MLAVHCPVSTHRCGESFTLPTPSAPRRNDPVRLRLRARLGARGAAPVEAVRPLELARPATAADAAAAAGHRPQQGRTEQAVAVALGCHSAVSRDCTGLKSENFANICYFVKCTQIHDTKPLALQNL